MQIVNDLKKLPPIWDQDQEVHDVFMDDGYDQNKVGYWGNVDGQKTLVGFKYATSAQMGRIFSSMNSSGSGIYDVDGMSYTVSEYVENEVSRNKGFAYSEFKGALIHHGLKLAGFSGKKVSLSTTLPIGYYYKDGVADIEYISKVRDALQKPFTSADGADLASIVPNMHTIQPESVCAFLAYVLRDDAEEFEDINGSFCVCDIGGNTTDISVLVPGDEITINHKLSGSRHIGVLNIKDTLKGFLQQKFQVTNIPPAEVNRALTTGVFHFMNKANDVSDLVQSSLIMTAKRLMNFIDELVGDYSLNYIMFSGGGAQLLKTALRDVYKGAITTDTPEFDNLAGLALAKSL